MLFKYTVTILLIIGWSNFSNCQEIGDSFKKIIREGKVGKTNIIKSPLDTTWSTYLGEIRFGDKDSTFYVISEFQKVNSNSTWHGHSNVFLLDKNGKAVWRVLIGMPDELPEKLKNNYFYFKEGNQTIQSKFELVGNYLFCVHKNRCYEVVRE